MTKGDSVINADGWRATVVLVGQKNVLVKWLTGPIRGREGRVEKTTLKPAPRKRLVVHRKGEKL